MTLKSAGLAERSIRKTLQTLRSVDNFYSDRVGRISILFVVRNTLGAACLIPLIKEAEKRKGVKITITDEYDGCIDWPANGELAELKSLYYLPPSMSIFFKKWHYVFTTEACGLTFLRSTTKAFIYHGCGYGNLDRNTDDFKEDDYLKKIVRNSSLSLYFCNSYIDREVLSGHLESKHDLSVKKLFVSGMPRMDRLVNCDKSIRQTYLSGLGLNPDNKTVVISSHWTKKSLHKSFGVMSVEALSQSYPDINILVFGHGNLWRDDKGSLTRQFEQLQSSASNVRFLPNLEDTVPLLVSGDIFVGDNSSIFIEFCLMDKPVVFFDHPDFVFSDPLVEQLYKDASCHFSSIPQLVSAVGDCLTKQDVKVSQRKAVVDNFMAKRGRSSAYVMDAVEAIGKLSGPNSKNWPRIDGLLEHDCSNNGEGESSE